HKLVAISIVEASNVREAFDGSTTRKKNTGKCGGKAILPDPNALALYVRDLRREERAVTSGHMINFLRMNHSEWIESYIATRKDLQLLVTLIAKKRTQCNLEEVRRDFARGFHGQYPDLPVDSLYNADEIGLYYDMAPDTIWAVEGEGSYVADADKHSYRMTALLTVRADGKKLTILFVIRGAEGGTIERNEFDDYPDGHHYYMQKRAWMDGSVWRFYLRDVLAPSIENPSVLLVDNFDCHVSSKSDAIVGDELGCELHPSPPNSTSYCNPWMCQ
ncbi:hypothetical protein LEN26_009594, partial [Aphanomyces euteiches]